MGRSEPSPRSMGAHDDLRGGARYCPSNVHMANRQLESDNVYRSQPLCSEKLGIRFSHT